MTRFGPFAFRFAVLLFGGLAIACFVWTLIQSTQRLPDYAEACVLFNAARIRSGLTLYVDPALGAHDYGEPPARYYVAYVPLFSSLVALLPSSVALATARIIGLVTWHGTLAVSVATGAPRHRRVALVAALFVASLFLFNRWSASAKGDAIALSLAALALSRSLRAGRADAPAGVLFALAWLFKPSVLALGVGVIAASMLAPGKHRFRAATAAAVVVGMAAAVLHVVSGGVAFGHLRAALGLAVEWRLLVQSALSRLPFVIGLLLAGLVAAWPLRDRPEGRIALAGLTLSWMVSIVALGKPGGASNYLMEPSMACVVVLSRCGLPHVISAAKSVVLAGAVGLSGVWSATATWRSLRDDGAIIAEEVRAVASIRAACLDRPHAIVMSTDPGVELTVNARLHTHGLELTMETAAGRFPEAVWIDDVRSPNVRCVVTYIGKASPPDSPTGAYPPGVGMAMRDRFRFERVVAGFAVYRAR